MDNYNAHTSDKAVRLVDQSEGTVDSLASPTLSYRYPYLLLIMTALRALSLLPPGSPRFVLLTSLLLLLSITLVLFHGNTHCFRSLFLDVLSKLVCRDRLIAPGAYLPSMNSTKMLVERWLRDPITTLWTRICTTAYPFMVFELFIGTESTLAPTAALPAMNQATVDSELELLKRLVATTMIMNRHMSASGDALVVCEGTVLAWLKGVTTETTEKVLWKATFRNSLSTVRKWACNPCMFEG